MCSDTEDLNAAILRVSVHQKRDLYFFRVAVRRYETHQYRLSIKPILADSISCVARRMKYKSRITGLGSRFLVVISQAPPNHNLALQKFCKLFSEALEENATTRYRRIAITIPFQPAYQSKEALATSMKKPRDPVGGTHRSRNRSPARRTVAIGSFRRLDDICVHFGCCCNSEVMSANL